MNKQQKKICNRLVRETRNWALGQDIDSARVRELRRRAILLNHAHYFESIPLYRKLAEEEGYGQDAGIDTIRNKLMLSADIFKSYQQKWLDDGDFSAMSKWLRSIFHRDIDSDFSGVSSIDEWIDRLSRAGITVVYSSGTSGTFSFVPRDTEDRAYSRTANIACLIPLLSRRMTGGSLSGNLLKTASRFVSPDTVTRLIKGKALNNYDAVFLGFHRGKMGNQALIEELSPLFRRSYYLYDSDINGSVLRYLQRGARTDEEQRMMDGLKEIIGRGEANYLRILDDIDGAVEDGQKIFIFGAPFQFKELCEAAAGHNRKPVLREGSLALFGGGWKSFDGEEIDRETLVQMIADSLGLSPKMILEGYSMTEINMLTLRCEHGRFHIPPVIEPVLFNEALEPVDGTEGKGIFGFLDPLAASYPGFIISGDYVRMTDGKCDCGLSGPAITEIGRLPGTEVKGCGGIMGSFEV